MELGKEGRGKLQLPQTGSFLLPWYCLYIGVPSLREVVACSVMAFVDVAIAERAEASTTLLNISPLINFSEI